MDIIGASTSESATAHRLLLDILSHIIDGYLHANSTPNLDATVDMICTEVVTLEEWLSDQSSKTLEGYAETLEKILALFEGLVKIKALHGWPREQLRVNRSTFTRLPTLCGYLESLASGPEKVAKFRESFQLHTSRDGPRSVLKKLMFYNDALREPEETIALWAPPEKARRPAYEVRERANILYQALSEGWHRWPQCGQYAHSAKLCVSFYEQCEELEVEVDFDFLFSTYHFVWQQSTVTVAVQEDECDVQSTVRFDTPPVRRKARQGTRVKDICESIRGTTTRQHYLHLVVDTRKVLWQVSSSEAGSTNDLSDFISMTTLVETLQEERLDPNNFHGLTLIDIKERRVIAILLSHVLLHFCGSPWLSEEWDKASISFLRHNGREQMVLSTDLQKYKPAPDLDALKRTHRFPAILSLGILLMELELKKTFEFSLEKFKAKLDDEERKQCETDANTKLYVSKDMVKELRKNYTPESGFFTAINACIDFAYTRDALGGTISQGAETDDIINDRGKLYSEISLRRKIYQEIVAPLERDFCKSYSIKSSEILEKLPIAFSFWNCPRLSIAPQTHPAPVPTPLRSLSVTPASKPAAPISSIVTEAVQHVTALRPGMETIYFHDVPLSANTQRQDDAKGWIKDYNNAAEKVIAPLRLESNFKSHRVKVAILDTGVDLKDPFLLGKQAVGRIIECKNWAEPPNTPAALGGRRVPSTFDASGHGTHIAALLLKIAPDCDVYIGRVADANGAMVAPAKIAEAIDYAAETWKVDLITMPLGFLKPVDVIEQAIKRAFVNDVIIFAATSNRGRNRDVEFPASAHDVVIGVHSCDAHGTKSTFSPEALQKSDNFSVLGEEIESSWPKHMKGPTQCRSGTSYATPIAAGTAANMMLYARMRLRGEFVKEIESCAGMKKVLKSVSLKTSDGYNYLRPWLLWEKNEDRVAAHFLTLLDP